MAYSLQTPKGIIYFCANIRTASTAISRGLMEMGAIRENGHHSKPAFCPPNATVFQVVRHPCDVLVSYWFNRATGWLFSEWLKMVFNDEQPYFVGNRMYDKFEGLVTDTLQFENLEDGLEELFATHELGPPLLLRSPSKRDLDMGWWEFLKDSEIADILDRYKIDCEAYGYGDYQPPTEVDLPTGTPHSESSD